MAYKMEVFAIIDNLKCMAKELLAILEKDHKDMVLACEKAQMMASILKKPQSHRVSQQPAQSSACASQLQNNLVPPFSKRRIDKR